MARSWSFCELDGRVLVALASQSQWYSCWWLFFSFKSVVVAANGSHIMLIRCSAPREPFWPVLGASVSWMRVLVTSAWYSQWYSWRWLFFPFKSVVMAANGAWSLRGLALSHMTLFSALFPLSQALSMALPPTTSSPRLVFCCSTGPRGHRLLVSLWEL